MAKNLPSILLVDDQPDQVLALRQGLERSGRKVLMANDLASARVQLTSTVFDLIVLDREMQTINGAEDGLEICREIRRLAIPSRVVFYTNLSSPGEHLNGWNAGADDYIQKTWPVEIALARCEAHLARSSTPPIGQGIRTFIHPALPPELHLVVDERMMVVGRAKDMDVLVRGEKNKASLTVAEREWYRAAKLTNMDSAVFFHLLANRDRWITEEELLENVWKYSRMRIDKMRDDPDANSGLVPTTIARIRRKIDSRLERESAPRGFDTRRPWAYIHTSAAESDPIVRYRFVDSESPRPEPGETERL